ncbi:MAG: sulfatase-like hydrolase/transferase [Actinobacteria bacterium]|nr:sulfatase-like hydrolase/transferase [Actinomycetota bacterium]
MPFFDSDAYEKLVEKVNRRARDTLADSASRIGELAFELRQTEGRDVPDIPTATRGTEKQPNILFICTDQERFDIPDVVPMPGHEWMRERGLNYTEFNVNTTPCSPSRSSMYFGQHTQHTKMTTNLGAYPMPEIPDDMPSVGHYLRANGYYTAYKGKWHLSEMGGNFELTYGVYPNTRNEMEPFGFSDWNIDGDPHGSTWTGYEKDASIASNSVDWLHRQGKSLAAEGTPWMLAVNFVNPHDIMYYQYGPGQVDTRKHEDFLAPLARPPIDDFYSKDWGVPVPQSHWDQDTDHELWSHSSYREFCNMAYGRIPNEEEAWYEYQNYYFNCIRDADRHLVTVLKGLEDSGMLDNTIIIFTADHGEMAGTHALRQKGPFMYKENMRVPFIVVHPDNKQASDTAALGSTIDIVPTLLGMAGVSSARRQELYPELVGLDLSDSAVNKDGRTLRDEVGILLNYNSTMYIDPSYIEKIIEHQPATSRQYVMLLDMAIRAGAVKPSLDNPGLFRGINDGRYKFARYFAASEHHTPTDWETLTAHNQLEMYDLENDPDEMNNLAATARDENKELIMDLNARTNALMQAEVGEDLGGEIGLPERLTTL